MKVSAQYAVEHFDELASAADRGEEVEIARDFRPALMLVATPANRPSSVRRPRSEMAGIFKGRMWVSPNFDSPELNGEIADEFENGACLPDPQR